MIQTINQMLVNAYLLDAEIQEGIRLYGHNFGVSTRCIVLRQALVSTRKSLRAAQEAERAFYAALPWYKKLIAKLLSF